MAAKRKFIEIEIPLTRESVEILGPVETLKNKTIKLDLTRKLKGKSTEGIFAIIPEQDSIKAYPKKINIMKTYLKRVIRKNTSYVEDSFEIECKDIKAKIKPFLITRKKVSRAIKNNLRRTTKNFLIEHAKNNNYLEICRQIFKGELQKQILPKLKKIYPLSLCEIRVIETKEINSTNKDNPIIVDEKKEQESNDEIEPEEIIQEA